MTEQNNALAQEEMDFKAWHKAAWEEVDKFYEMVKSGQRIILVRTTPNIDSPQKFSRCIWRRGLQR